MRLPDTIRFQNHLNRVELLKFLIVHPETPSEILRFFVEGVPAQRIVDSRILRHQNLPGDIMENLVDTFLRTPPEDTSTDEVRKVVSSLVSNPSIPAEILNAPPSDDMTIHSAWRSSVLLNPALSDEAAFSRRYYVAGEARRQFPIRTRSVDLGNYGVQVVNLPNLSTETINAFLPVRSMKVVSPFLSHPNVPEEVRRQGLQRSTPIATKRIFAYNPTLTTEEAVRLSEDDNTSVFSTLAINPATPASMLSSMTRHKNRSVRAKVLSNPSLPVEILAYKYEKMRGQNRYSYDFDHLLMNPLLPAEYLADHLESVGEVWMRMLLGCRPSETQWESMFQYIKSSGSREEWEESFALLFHHPVLMDALPTQIETYQTTPEDEEKTNLLRRGKVLTKLVA